jgi:phosphoribosylglycinamide formyltransferase-1
VSTRKRVGILISGRGSNMVALIEACRNPDYPAGIALVLSNRPEAEGLARAQSMGIPVKAIDHKTFPNRAAFDAALSAALQEAGIELVCNAGFMRLHSRGFVEEWEGRQINIHPSLLPAFPGLHPQRQALEAGVRISGATVHFVTAKMDAGPIIAQIAVPVRSGDDENSLAERILAAEHRLYPLALRLVASGSARMERGRVILEDHAEPPLPKHDPEKWEPVFG